MDMRILRIAAPSHHLQEEWEILHRTHPMNMSALERKDAVV
jgi:hypothetical protein